jgi:hypothetical protein
MIITAALTKSDGEGGLTFALQALLSRHESYIAESEEERRKMAATMSQLEGDKRSLEAENARVSQENKKLLDQLEGINTQIVNSDAHIDSLMATLSSAQFENKRLAALASKAAELEAQLTAMEIGQASLQEELTTTKQDERSAVHRWKDAVTRLRDLDDQVQLIEKETRDEREKHVEIVGQMERKRMIEKELESAAGRLKGAAAANTLGRDKNGKNVVSHFVRDILQDNANLQAGILELRELLQTSNGEVQNLRERVLEHQPISSDHGLEPASLVEEFEQSRPKAISQEVHVHHHYHAKITAKEKGPSFRRLPRRRGLVSSSSTSSTGSQTPLPRRGSNVMAVPRPGLRINRWSAQSSATDFSAASSGPSSPYSDHRKSSIFDRIDPGFESSRPTSPESAVFTSPRFQIQPHCGLKITELTDVSEDEMSSNTRKSSDTGKHLEGKPPLQTTVSNREISPLCLTEQAPVKDNLPPEPSAQDHALDVREHMPPPITLDQYSFEQPRLRRSGSHESLVSISGMDIHLPQHRNKPRCLVPKPTSPSETPDQLNFSIAFPSLQPLASIAEVNASSTNLVSPSTSACLIPVSLLSGLARGKPSQPGTKGLGQLVGSWVRGKWGIAPMASTVNPREQTAFSDWSARTPGINQKGPVMGFKPLVRTPSEVNARVLDESLLRESLAE